MERSLLLPICSRLRLEDCPPLFGLAICGRMVPLSFVAMNEVDPKKLVAVLTAFTAVIGITMYPIYFYPKKHEKEYSELLAPVRPVLLTLFACRGDSKNKPQRNPTGRRSAGKYENMVRSIWSQVETVR